MYVGVFVCLYVSIHVCMQARALKSLSWRGRFSTGQTQRNDSLIHKHTQARMRGEREGGRGVTAAPADGQ